MQLGATEKLLHFFFFFWQPFSFYSGFSILFHLIAFDVEVEDFSLGVKITC